MTNENTAAPYEIAITLPETTTIRATLDCRNDAGELLGQIDLVFTREGEDSDHSS